jgi:hypothetical protein
VACSFQIIKCSHNELFKSRLIGAPLRRYNPARCMHALPQLRMMFTLPSESIVPPSTVHGRCIMEGVRSGGGDRKASVMENGLAVLDRNIDSKLSHVQ